MKSRKLIDVVEACERVLADPGLSWEDKFDAIFSSWSSTIRPALAELRIDLDWYDPDTSYEEDVTAFMTALSAIKPRLSALASIEESAS